MLRSMENNNHKPARKSTVEEIKARFDADVERFSQLETGQTATMDAALCLEIIATTAVAVTPKVENVLDIGCGAGNYTLKLLQKTAPAAFDVTLLDLSQNMLTRAKERVGQVSGRAITTAAEDIRDWDAGEAQFDVILAAAFLHHLRTDAEWESVFHKFYRALRPGGALWIFDMLAHDSHPGIHATQWARYGQYLVGLKDANYRDTVFAYIEKEDTPRSLLYQTDLLRRVGFSSVEVLHKNGPFAAFGGVKQ
jgi:tRNA (cmo5U34)-methyltransferase